MRDGKPVFAFFAVSRTGNRGAVSMLESAIDHLTATPADGWVHVFTVYPKQDARLAKPRPRVDLRDGGPIRLVTWLIPMCILWRLLRMLHLAPPPRWWGGDMQALLESDVCVMAGGTTFTDAQKFKVIYNVACAAPAILLGKRSMFYSQTMGPFNHPFNRFWAKWVLNRVDLVVPRGKGSYDHVKNLGISHAMELPDSAFTLVVPKEAEDAIRAEYRPLLEGRTVVGISVNTIVQGKCNALGIDHNGVWVRFIGYLQERGYYVLLIPHSMRPGSKSLHNNDLVPVHEIYDRLPSKENIHIVEKHYDCKELRVLVGLADYYVASRFHSMISALCTETPVSVIGWGYQKYREVLAEFDLESYCRDAAELSFEGLVEGFERIVREADSIKARMREHLPEVQARSRRNHEEALRLAELGRNASQRMT